MTICHTITVRAIDLTVLATCTTDVTASSYLPQVESIPAAFPRAHTAHVSDGALYVFFEGRAILRNPSEETRRG